MIKSVIIFLLGIGVGYYFHAPIESAGSGKGVRITSPIRIE